MEFSENQIVTQPFNNNLSIEIRNILLNSLTKCLFKPKTLLNFKKIRNRHMI